MSENFKKFALLLAIPFFLVACGGGDEEEEEESGSTSSAPKKKAKKKRKKGEPVLVTTGKAQFINICMDATDATFSKNGDPKIKLFSKQACEGELLQAFFVYQTASENRKNTLSFNADHVLYNLYNTPKYWSKEKTAQVKAEREAKAKEQAERIKQRKEELQKRQAAQSS